MDPHPESVPINALVAIEGTPLAEAAKNGSDADKAAAAAAKPPSALEMTRMIATARIVLPKTMVRLSAGRMSFTQAEQSFM